ncbi:hypothetical protein J437_LFUL018029 [Ladona fulva]|uniref:DNA-directed DNA polymerase n=1 Tax=Ladona fulva TaxID=123851 RepID=A0A8K0KN56_LADFU|nr:hypothetical protein J437_LFUL018029 [Ladona fulva]
MKSTKILSISYDELRFVDSLNFLPIALSKFPSALGLDKSMAKGYFPHLFNRKENSDRRGPLPPVEMYGIDSMTSKERDDFLEWHRELSKEYIFDMKTEKRKYCAQDVRILSSACLRFRDIFLSSTGVSSFRETVAIASSTGGISSRPSAIEEDALMDFVGGEAQRHPHTAASGMGWARVMWKTE